MKAYSINGNKKAAIESDFDVPVEILFRRRRYRIGSILTFLILKYQSISKTLSTAVESTVSHLALIVATNKKQFINLALSPTDNKYHETECILRTNDTIKECVSAVQRGNKLVPVPVHDAGCEVGLHGGKWDNCQLKN